MSNRVKEVLAQIEIPKELQERSKLGVQAASFEIKGRGRVSKMIMKVTSIAAAAVLFVGLMATVNTGFANSLQGFFKDIVNWKGAVIGTEYNQATEEVKIKISNLNLLENELVVPISVTFEKSDKAPYNLIEALTLGEFALVNQSGDKLEAEHIRMEHVDKKKYSFDIKDSDKLLSEVESSNTTEREFIANLIINIEQLDLNDTYTLIIRSLNGHSKGDAPIEINGKWDLEVVKK